VTILIIGADGMIGHGLWQHFSRCTDHAVKGSVRSKRNLAAFGEDWHRHIFVTGPIETDTALEVLFENVEPTAVINCAGATPHVVDGESPLVALSSNALLPHRLHKMSRKYGARFIHLSTDCVFSGARGNYAETDPVDAITYYGLSKALGEVRDANDAATIRTSPIGYELSSSRGLLGWFLAQSGVIKGFTNAYFSGLTNQQLAKIIDRYFIGGGALSGVFHVTGPKISKFALVSKLKTHFRSRVEIVEDGKLVLDRSLNGSMFCELTGYQSPDWDEMIANLVAFAEGYPSSALTSAAEAQRRAKC
jgi:dTDP-4-dehydrorhamnose reductase